MLITKTIDSPLGTLRLFARGDELAGALPAATTPTPPARAGAQRRARRDRARSSPSTSRASAATFDLPLAPRRHRRSSSSVWRALRAIPLRRRRAATASSRARSAGPTASRAVGAANGKNPISIIVPCHRVIGADGSLTGYGGGMDAKRWLLAHEGARSFHLAS